MYSTQNSLKSLIKNKQFLKAAAIIEHACEKYKEFLRRDRNEID